MRMKREITGCPIRAMHQQSRKFSVLFHSSFSNHTAKCENNMGNFQQLCCSSFILLAKQAISYSGQTTPSSASSSSVGRPFTGWDALARARRQWWAGVSTDWCAWLSHTWLNNAKPCTSLTQTPTLTPAPPSPRHQHLHLPHPDINTNTSTSLTQTLTLTPPPHSPQTLTLTPAPPSPRHQH